MQMTSSRLLGIFVAIITFATSSVAHASCQERFKVYYIPLDVEFYQPPLPLEKHAHKTFEIRSCALADLFEETGGNMESARRDDKLARIKIVRLSDEDSIIIDQEKYILRNGRGYKLPEAVINKALNAIKKAIK